MSTTARTQGRSWEDFCERLFAQNQFAIKLGLTSMKRALEQLQDERHESLCVLVAGTNGKGSTASALSALLTRAGLRVGLYTSPHLVDLTERFRVQGRALERDVVQRIGEDTLDRFGDAGADVCLTFFELTTVMAVRLFAQQKVDVAIYEVGLGGRLDATNALTPDMSVITPIGLDHQAYLGEDILGIAAEKAGIMRASTPVVLGPQEHQGVLPRLLRLAQTHQARVEGSYGLQFDASALPEHVRACAASEYMVRHWSTAWFAAQALLSSLGQEAPPQTVEALCQVKWHGRLDTRELTWGGRSCEVLLDAAHNLDGVASLLQALDERAWRPDEVWFGAMHDKDIEGMLRPVLQRGWPVQPVLIQNGRAAKTQRFVQAFEALDATVDVSRPPALLRDLVSLGLGDGRRVLVFGSLYLEGEFYELMNIDVSSVHGA